MYDNEVNIELLIKSALENLDISAWQWYEESFFGGKEKNNQVEKIVLEMQKNLAVIEGWGMLVPEHRIPSLIDISLENNLLRSSAVRSLLISNSIKIGNHETLLNFLEIFGLSENLLLEDVIKSAEEMHWKPSTILSFKIVELLGLPKIYAVAGNSDNRDEFEIITPISPLKCLLDFQLTVKNQIIRSLNNNSRGLVVMPTGSGKTRTTIEAVIEYFLSNNLPIEGVVWLADRDELCEQAFQSFKEILLHRSNHSIKLSRYWGGNDISFSINKINSGVIVTSMQQIDRRFKSEDPMLIEILNTCKLFIIDEAHRNIKSNDSLIRYMKRNGNNPGIIGITATPKRREKIETNELFQMFDNNPIVPLDTEATNIELISRELTEKGILAKRKILSISDMDIDTSDISYNSTLKTSFGIINSLIEKGAKSIIAFAEDVKHSKQLAGSLRMNNIPARHLDSSTPTMQRRQILHDFQNNKISVLVNYGILTTGFDAPNVDTVAIFRKIDDFDQPVITQMIGRGLRGPKFGGTESCMIYIRGRD